MLKSAQKPMLAMLDATRVLTTTYRVKHLDSGFYQVTVYPKQSEVTASYVTQGEYRPDALPRWIIEGVRMLDVAGVDTRVPFYGSRIGGSYWFESIDSDGTMTALSHELQDIAKGVGDGRQED
jgi:hypothetical protein